jgi:hypothetical protein
LVHDALVRWAVARNLGMWMVATAAATGVTGFGVSMVTERVADTIMVRPAASAADHNSVNAATTDSGRIQVGPTPMPTPKPAASREKGDGPRSATAATTFASHGGVVTVRCAGNAIHLVSAHPNRGYQMAVLTTGPLTVDIRFSDRHDDKTLQTSCDVGVAQLTKAG